MTPPISTNEGWCEDILGLWWPSQFAWFLILAIKSSHMSSHWSCAEHVTIHMRASASHLRTRRPKLWVQRPPSYSFVFSHLGENQDAQNGQDLASWFSNGSRSPSSLIMGALHMTSGSSDGSSLFLKLETDTLGSPTLETQQMLGRIYS